VYRLYSVTPDQWEKFLLRDSGELDRCQLNSHIWATAKQCVEQPDGETLSRRNIQTRPASLFTSVRRQGRQRRIRLTGSVRIASEQTR